jgi:hypothetical protein
VDKNLSQNCPQRGGQAHFAAKTSQNEPVPVGSSATDSKRRSGELAARPVLARLPDVSAEVQMLRTEQKTASGVGYRIDPPQGTERGPRATLADRSAQFPTLKSELIYSPRPSRAHQPHIFERSRRDLQQSRGARRDSPILPRENPFAIPRRGILDSLAPFLRFAMLVALFTAAGTWIQLSRFQTAPATKPVEQRGGQALLAPQTPHDHRRDDTPTIPDAKTAERPAGSPTSAGPVRATPESNTRVGRAREEHDFAELRGEILPAPPSNDELNFAMPELGSASGELPRVHTTEPPAAEVANEPARSEEVTRAPEVARIPGFTIDNPPPR